MGIEILKVQVEDRIQRKMKRAESAYVKAGCQKETRNCRNHGPQLSERIHVCKIACIGMDGNTAGQCWNQKASSCEEFELKRSPESLRSEFQEMSEEEIALRWPQIGELLWMRSQIEEIQKKRRVSK